MPEVQRTMSMPGVTFGRREFLRGGAAATAMLAWRGRGAWAQAPAAGDRVAQTRAMGATATLTVVPLRGNVSMIESSGFGNMAVLTGPDGKLVVDSGYSSARPHVEAVLTGLGSMPVRTLVNTHWHFDHTDGNEWMHGAGATIVAQDNTRKRLSGPHEWPAMGMRFDAAPKGAWPVVCFKEALTMYMNGATVTMEHYKPAHTDSDISVRFDELNVVHLGDTYFRSFPVIDGSSDGSIRGMIAAAERSLGQVDRETKIIPGHGPLGDAATLKEYHAMLVDVADRVGSLKAAGKSVDEAIAAKPTARYDEAWGKGFVTPELFVRMVYPGV
ncbi:MAG: MBL fold metallo-hydrolase [Acidobacteriota bacterium]|nr:MBL fold metallo-hydrolase [Acidobacteriota bacterium]